MEMFSLQDSSLQ